MTEPVEILERRIEELRTTLRRAVVAGDRTRSRALRAELRRAEHEWEEALADLEEQTPAGDTATVGDAAGAGAGTDRGEPGTSASGGADDTLSAPDRASRAGPLLPLREQVHQALTLLTVPAAPRLIIAVHEAFSGTEIVGARLTSLRRDEERSFRSAPYSRPYYICSALTHDMLTPARGLLAVSTWPMPQRMITPLSPRADFLTAAIEIAKQVARLDNPRPLALRLLWGFAANIPGAADSQATMQPSVVSRAAQAELEVHADDDRVRRQSAAARARKQLDDVQQLFGVYGLRQIKPASTTRSRAASG